MQNHDMGHKEMTHKNIYKNLFWMLLLSFISMYILMYTMVNTLGNVFNSFNQLYMALLMTMPMVILEIVIMSKMYMNKTLNIRLVGIAFLVFIFAWFGIRSQLAINDEQFLRSMIPHHAGAILMCEKANLSKPELKELCENIISSQQKEIDQMKTWLENM